MGCDGMGQRDGFNGMGFNGMGLMGWDQWDNLPTYDTLLPRLPCLALPRVGLS